MPSRSVLAAVSLASLTIAGAGPVTAQSLAAEASPGGSATASGGQHAVAPAMSATALTLAPVAPGSSRMHTVPTPKVPDRTTMTGGNTNGGAN